MSKQTLLRSFRALLEKEEIPVSVIRLDNGGRHRKIVLRRLSDNAEASVPVSFDTVRGNDFRNRRNWAMGVRRWALSSEPWRW